MTNKLSYFFLLINLKVVFLLSFLLRKTSFVYNPKKKKHDLILFPFTQKGSDGYSRRFEVYFKFLEKDNIDYHVCNIFDNEYIIKKESGKPKDRYKLYRKIAWIRLRQVLKARKYKAVFIHRGLFPYYPDLETPFFEKLLRKLNNNITIDFWDSVWIFEGEKLIKETIRYSDKISVVNNFISDYFSFSKKPKLMFPIGVDLSKYSKKENYDLKTPISLFYTGSPENVKNFLKLMEPILLKLKTKYQFELRIVSRARIYIENININYFDFDENTFFKLLKNSDIGLYKVNIDEKSKGKMAMKVLDYMSAGLPTLVTPSGLSPFCTDKKNTLFCCAEKDWIRNFELLIENKNLRMNIGKNGLGTVLENHSLNNSYLKFKQLIEKK